MALSTYFLRRTTGGRFSLEDTALNSGNRFFVHSGTGTDASNRGQSPDGPFASLDYAVGQAVANQGDRIYIMPGHSQTLASSVSINKAGVSIIGLGEGMDRPEFTVNHAGDGLNVTASDVVIENLYFNEATAASTANINLAAERIIVRCCHFDLGANDLDCLTVTGAADGSVIEGCEFLVTANGPDSAITLEGACDDLTIRDNYFSGGSTTNTWDDAAIDAGSQTPLNVRVEGNTFAYGTAYLSTGAAPRVMGGNRYLRGARAAAGVSLDLFASASVTGAKSGTAEDPTTLPDAVDLAQAGDRVLLYPGTYTITSSLALDVANLTMRPVHYVSGQRTASVEIANDTADVNTADITAAGVTIEGIFFTKGINNTVDGTELLDVGADRFTLRDCILDLEARTNADALNLATSTKHHLVDNCLFTDGASGKSYIVWACSTLEVKHCKFDASAALVVCLEQIASPGDGSFFHDNVFLSNGSTGDLASWQTSPGKQAITRNWVMGCANDTNVLGDDADLDPYMIENYRDGAATGAGTIINPSVT